MSDDLAPREAWVDWADIETQYCAEIRDHGSFGGQRCLIVPLKDGEPGRWEAVRRRHGSIRLDPLPETRTVDITVGRWERPVHTVNDSVRLEIPADMTDDELLERIRKAVER